MRAGLSWVMADWPRSYLAVGKLSHEWHPQTHDDSDQLSVTYLRILFSIKAKLAKMSWPQKPWLWLYRSRVGLECRSAVERRPTWQPPPTQNAGIDDLICRVKGDVFSLTSHQLAIVISHQQHGIDSQPPTRLHCTGVH